MLACQDKKVEKHQNCPAISISSVSYAKNGQAQIPYKYYTQNLKRYSLFGPSKTESSSNDHYTKSSPVCGSGKHLFSVQTLLTNLHAKRSQEQIFLTEDKKGEWREEDAKKRGSFPILIYFFFFAPSQYNYLKRDGPDR